MLTAPTDPWFWFTTTGQRAAALSRRRVIAKVAVVGQRP